MPPDDPHAPLPPPAPRNGGESPGKRTDRELVEAALQAAKPRTDAPGFDDDPLPPANAFPGYEIVREIHRGGQGVVYQAIQKATTRKVALKVLHGGPFTGSKGRARFEREVAILAQLQHPNIVSVLDSGTSVGQAFYVMDYVSGQTLDAWMAGDPRPVQDVLALFAKICDAVNAAHLKGITHRDLKPSNIRIDHSGEPHILDFGLAKVVIGEVTEETQPQVMSMTGQFIGSLPWASPEQAEGVPGKVDLRTDVYSLGVILYQLLTGGKFPYEVVGNMRDVMENILRAEPWRPSTVRRQVNDEVETIVLKALQKERDRRYQSAGELGRDIRRYLSGEPIEAMRDSGWYVIRKTLRKYKAPTAVAVLFLVLVVAFGVTSFVLYRRAEHARAETASALSQKADALRIAEEQKGRAESLNEAYARVTTAGRAFRQRTLTEYFTRINTLLGATAAKEELLRDGLAYLDALRKESSKDPSFEEELAEALEALGKIEAGLYTPRVGKTADGGDHLREAAAIRQKLLDERPGDAPRQSRLSGVLLQVALVQRVGQKFDDALGTAQRALELAERAAGGAAAQGVREDEAEEMRAGVANANVLIGELKIRMAHAAPSRAAAEELTREGEARYDLAAAYWKQRSEAHPDDAKAARLVVALADKKSQSTMLRADALRRDAAALAAGNDPPGARAAYANALALYEGATRLSQESVRSFEALLQRFKGDAEITRSRWISLLNVGDSLTKRAEVLVEMGRKLGEPARADQARALQEEATVPLKAGVAAARVLAAADPANVEAIRAVYVSLNKLASLQRDLGAVLAGMADNPTNSTIRERGAALLADSVATLEESRAQTELVAERDPTMLHRRDAVVVYSDLAETEVVRRRYSEGRRWYEKAMNVLDQMVAQGGTDRSSKDYTDMQTALEACKRLEAAEKPE